MLAVLSARGFLKSAHITQLLLNPRRRVRPPTALLFMFLSCCSTNWSCFHDLSCGIVFGGLLWLFDRGRRLHPKFLVHRSALWLRCLPCRGRVQQRRAGGPILNMSSCQSKSEPALQSSCAYLGWAVNGLALALASPLSSPSTASLRRICGGLAGLRFWYYGCFFCPCQLSIVLDLFVLLATCVPNPVARCAVVGFRLPSRLRLVRNPSPLAYYLTCTFHDWLLIVLSLTSLCFAVVFSGIVCGPTCQHSLFRRQGRVCRRWSSHLSDFFALRSIAHSVPVGVPACSI